MSLAFTFALNISLCFIELYAWLRSMMDERTLTGLVLLNMYRNIDVETPKIINQFCERFILKFDYVIRLILNFLYSKNYTYLYAIVSPRTFTVYYP